MTHPLPPRYEGSANTELELDHLKRAGVLIAKQIKEQLLVFFVTFALPHEAYAGGIHDSEVAACASRGVRHQIYEFNPTFVEYLYTLVDEFGSHAVSCLTA
jgi:hypothetical protein